MSSIVLSAATRSSLLAAQSTADMMATTQNRLSTGKKVNSALDNPTSFFTAAGLDSRAGDLSDLLDGIGNGVQTIQAASQGITSIQKLVDQAKSLANQALQSSAAYSAKASFDSSAVTGATVDDLRGTATGGTKSTYTAAATYSAPTGPQALTIAGVAVTLDTTETTLAAAVTKINDALTTGSVTTVEAFDNGGKLALRNTANGTTAAATPAAGAGATAIFGTGVAAAGMADVSPLGGKTLTVSVAGANAQTITFGDGTGGTVKSLADLNTKLSPMNAQASLSSDGKLSITTTNDYGAESLQIGGTATGSTNPFGTIAASAKTATMGGDGMTNRNNLVSSYNALLSQIDQLAKDASFNGVNLLSGDNLKLTFNEKNTSSLTVSGTDGSSTGLGLSSLGNTDFADTTSINKVLTKIQNSTAQLRSQAATFGSNLTVVQNRQDFSKNLINVLQTGSANLVNADLNEEAANSQALSTRSSLAISALSLANTAQQGVLQLLR